MFLIVIYNCTYIFLRQRGEIFYCYSRVCHTWNEIFDKFLKGILIKEQAKTLSGKELSRSRFNGFSVKSSIQTKKTCCISLNRSIVCYAVQKYLCFLNFLQFLSIWICFGGDFVWYFNTNMKNNETRKRIDDFHVFHKRIGCMSGHLETDWIDTLFKHYFCKSCHRFSIVFRSVCIIIWFKPFNITLTEFFLPFGR